MAHSNFERFAAVVVDPKHSRGVGLACAGTFAKMEFEQGQCCEDWLIAPPPEQPGVYIWEGEASPGGPDPDDEPRFVGKWRKARPMEAYKLCVGEPLWPEPIAAA